MTDAWKRLGLHRSASKLARERKKEMARNVGGVERGIRLVVGVALLALGFLHVVTGVLAIAVYIVGVIALVTSAVRYCPAWSIFGINTSSPAQK